MRLPHHKGVIIIYVTRGPGEFFFCRKKLHGPPSNVYQSYVAPLIVGEKVTRPPHFDMNTNTHVITGVICYYNCGLFWTFFHTHSVEKVFSDWVERGWDAEMWWDERWLLAGTTCDGLQHHLNIINTVRTAGWCTRDWWDNLLPLEKGFYGY